MDLTGKFVQLELSDIALNHLLGGDPEDAAVVPRWQLLGEVVGETPGIGVWFRVTGIGTEDTEPRWKPASKVAYLIRWEWVMSAMIYEERPKNLEKIGFRPV